jgi:hypothetical protein
MADQKLSALTLISSIGTNDLIYVVSSGVSYSAHASQLNAVFDSRYLQASNNLSDVTASTARTNLGLGSIAVQAASSVAITGGTLAGTTISTSTLTGATVNTHYASVGTASDSAGTTTFDASSKESWKTTLANNTALKVTNATAGQRIVLRITQAASGGPYTPTYDGTMTITWFTAGAGAPAMPATASAVLKVILECTGSGTFDGHSAGATTAS